jgi:hypothetical protein
MFVYGFSDAYEIMHADREAKPRLVIRKEEKPEPITAQERVVTAARTVGIIRLYPIGIGMPLLERERG